MGNLKSFLNKATGKWEKTYERFIDVIKKDGLHIEVKFYGSFVKKETSQINKFLVQMEKDIRILKDGNFEYYFAKTKGIPDQATLHKQIKHILTDEKFANKIFKDFAKANKKKEQTIDDFINEFIASKFKVQPLD